MGHAKGLPRRCASRETDYSCEHCRSLVVPSNTRGWQEFEIPSWCWIGKGSKVWYSDSCSVKSMVEWQEPVQYGRDYQEQREKYRGSTIFAANLNSTGTITSEFARLQCNAQTATLKVHTPIMIRGTKGSGCYILSATVSQQSGKDIGSIRVPARAFDGKKQIEGQFILLSSKAEGFKSEVLTPSDELPDEIQHSTECREPEYNIMLIRWSDDNKVEYRVAWMKIARSAWEECETQKKRIVLG